MKRIFSQRQRIMLAALAFMAILNFLRSNTSARRSMILFGYGDEGSSVSVHRKQSSSPAKDSISIFLNSFFPGDEQGQFRAKGIVMEQLGQMANSYAASQNPTIFIKPLGAPDVLNQILLNDICHNATNGTLKCTLLEHPSEGSGGEIDTLVELHDFCKNTTNPEANRVVYLHNKGSFHHSEKNVNWRRSLTAAALHKDCLNPPDRSCTTCGLTFASPPRMFTNLFPGNMWSASCAYITKLAHPRTFVIRQNEMIQRAFRLRQSGAFAFEGNDHKAWVVGAGRYTAEHWIGSHPDITPCDVSVEPDYWWWEFNAGNSSLFSWSMFPRPERQDVAPTNDTDTRIRYFRLFAGHLFRHIHIFNQTPAESSWMYDVLPDGDFWKSCVKKYGNEVVKIVTGPSFNRTDKNACTDTEKQTM